MTKHVLQFTDRNMLMSGFNSTVTVVGFSYLSRRLSRIDDQLDRLSQKIREVKELLELEPLSRLKGAVNSLIHASSVDYNHQERLNLVRDARRTFSDLMHFYEQLYAKAETLERAIITEQYYTITALSLARCYAELDMMDAAINELMSSEAFWLDNSRRIARDLLLGETPYRFLSGKYAEYVDMFSIPAWMDFAEDEHLGPNWLEKLRAQQEKSNSGIFSTKPMKMIKDFGFSNPIEADIRLVIPHLTRLVHKSKLYRSFIQQYTLLAQQGLTLEEVNAYLKEVDPDAMVNGYLILERPQ